MSSELSRKELKKPDLILSELRSVYQWIDSHMHLVALIAVFIFVGLATLAGVDYYKDSQEEKALSVYYKAGKNLEQKKEELELKKSTDILGGINSEILELNKAVEKFPKSKAALLGDLKLANLYFHEKKYPEALSFYEKALHISPNKFYTVLCLYNLGYLNELLADYPKAIAWYSKITDLKKQRILLWTVGYRPNAFWVSSAYFGMARGYEKLKKLDQARETYLHVADEFSNTPYADQARAYAELTNE